MNNDLPSLQKEKIFYILTALIFIVATFLRFYKLDTFPAPIHQDELSNIYDGYCIAETGADRWGKEFPVVLRAFGEVDYRPALYGWFAAASIKIFGYSITAGKMPAASMGVLSLVFLFFSARKIGGNLFSLLSLLFAALMPWHIIYSRLAHEGAMLPTFFFSASILLWILAREKRYDLKFLVLLGFTNGFGVNGYQSSKLIFFLFSIILTIEIIKNSYPSFFKKLGAYYFAIIIGALPQLFYMITDPVHFFARAEMEIIPPGFSYEYIQQILYNIFINLSPGFLFLSSGTTIDLAPSRLLLIESCFLYAGIFLIHSLFRKKSVFNTRILILLLVVAVLPAALTGGPFALRADAAMALLPMFSAAGVLFIHRYITSSLLRNVYLSVVVVLTVWNAWYEINTYVENPLLQGARHQINLVAACKKLNEYKNDYDKVLIEHAGNQPYIYLAAFCMTPAQFHSAPKDVANKPGAFDKITRIDKYYYYSGSDIENWKETARTLMLLSYKTEKHVLIDSTVTAAGNYYFYKGKPPV